MRDVAARVGISQQAVSLVRNAAGVNDETRDRVFRPPPTSATAPTPPPKSSPDLAAAGSACCFAMQPPCEVDLVQPSTPPRNATAITWCSAGSPQAATTDTPA